MYGFSASRHPFEDSFVIYNLLLLQRVPRLNHYLVTHMYSCLSFTSIFLGLFVFGFVPPPPPTLDSEPIY